MKIKMKTCSAGPSGVHQAGSIRDVPEQQAVHLVGGGFAEYVGPVEIIESPFNLLSGNALHKALVAACQEACISDKGDDLMLRARLTARGLNPETETKSLDDMSHGQLQALCNKRGISAKGNKAALIERLKAKERAEADADEQPPVDEHAVVKPPENTAVRTE